MGRRSVGGYDFRNDGKDSDAPYPAKATADAVRQFMKRVNGELCAFNTVEIIKRYDPLFFIIENPASGRLWKYIEDVMGFRLPYLNLTRYNNYDYPLQKPTKFASNIDLGLKNDIIKQDIEWCHFSKSYNERSNIPQKLVIEIFEKVYKEFLKI